MKPVSRFEELESGAPRVPVRFGGQEYQLAEGSNLAAALMAAGVDAFRQTSHRGVGRAPFCMMGACFDCLVLVNGETRQACLMEVETGLDVQPARRMREGPYASR
ncbi:(2Fe-2S)-binding protein [Shimia abyssi]|uniref:2Fe-2S iron-sulfur cluster protein n=1 Tax=Shimia abyssi TaxID=1662395 RepID=A0A2P8FHM7_9RHOB|nr:(2Fe-2S)-binding protein [Shimia abyssi]PSL21233.1 2Fe-2S iron-sulfur cluster protein [Shimia abyssi]